MGVYVSLRLALFTLYNLYLHLEKCFYWDVLKSYEQNNKIVKIKHNNNINKRSYDNC